VSHTRRLGVPHPARAVTGCLILSDTKISVSDKTLLPGIFAANEGVLHLMFACSTPSQQSRALFRVLGHIASGELKHLRLSLCFWLTERPCKGLDCVIAISGLHERAVFHATFFPALRRLCKRAMLSCAWKACNTWPSSLLESSVIAENAQSQ